MEKQIPKYSVQENFGKQHQYAVCVFVINEGEKVKKQIQEMSSYNTQVDIIIADGGSTDGSLKIEYLKSNNIRTLLTKQGNGKLSAQMRMAFDYCLQQGYKGVIVVDGNGKDDISAFPSFIEKLDEGYDHIQGSRYIAGGKEENTPLLRKWGVRLLHAPLISLASHKWCTDTTNGFRAYSSKILSDENLCIFRDVFSTYELHYYLNIEAGKKGFKCGEIPVTRKYPKTGKTPTKIQGWRGNLLILKILFNSALGRYNLKK